MRISFILPPVNMSGGVRVVVIYAQYLVAQGHEVILISPPGRSKSLITKIKHFIHGKGWPPKPGKGKSFIDGSGLNHKKLETFRAPQDSDVPDGDIVIATWWSTAEWVNALSAKKGAKVYFVQHYEIHHYLPKGRVEATYRMPLHKIVIADWLKKVCENQYQDFNTDLVPNAVDKTQFFADPRSKQPKPTIGFLYSPIHFKGVDITLKAIQAVKSSLADVRIVSFGAFKLPRNSELKDIDFHYLPEQDSIRDIYATCDVWVTASRSEGFNLPAMEAMACRTPVVATRTGWPEEAIKDGQNGYLVDVEDSDALATSILKVLRQTENQWRHMSDAAFKTVADSSWENSAKLFEQALYHACDRAKNNAVAGECKLNKSN